MSEDGSCRLAARADHSLVTAQALLKGLALGLQARGQNHEGSLVGGAYTCEFGDNCLVDVVGDPAWLPYSGPVGVRAIRPGPARGVLEAAEDVHVGPEYVDERILLLALSRESAGACVLEKRLDLSCGVAHSIKPNAPAFPAKLEHLLRKCLGVCGIMPGGLLHDKFEEGVQLVSGKSEVLQLGEVEWILTRFHALLPVEPLGGIAGQAGGGRLFGSDPRPAIWLVSSQLDSRR